jgi:hypothetical protein
MPFFDGQTLLFCQAGSPIEYQTPREGGIWRILTQKPELRAHFAQLPRHSTLRYRPWKLAWCPWQDRRPRPLFTGLPADAVECSPAFYREGDVYHVSFLGGVPGPQGLTYFLYQMSGNSLDQLSRPDRVSEQPTRLGFVSARHICTESLDGVRVTERARGLTFQLILPWNHLYRATFASDAPQQLLLSGQDEQGVFRTLQYDCDTGATHEVQAAGPLYKASLCGGEVVFAYRGEGDFEDRHLRRGSASLVSWEGQIRRRL